MSHSAYWLDPITEHTNLGLDRMMRLASIRRAIGNFVHILTRKNDIKVQFSSGEKSYTDGTTVTISATDDPNKFDHMVGLALHEGAHCLLSDFPFLNAVMESYRFYAAIHPDLRTFVAPATMTSPKVIEDVKECILDLMNIIEDRRIDTYVYDKAPGYRPYYDAMYREVFYNEKLEEALRTDPRLRVPSVQNYRDWLLMSFSDSFDPTALPGLQEMADLIDIAYVRKFDSPRMPDLEFWTHSQEMLPDPFLNGYIKPYNYDQFPEIWKTANQLLILILKYTQQFSPKDKNQMSFGNGKDAYPVGDIPQDKPNGTGNPLPNLDGSGAKYDLPTLIEAVRKAVAGQVDKKKLTTQQNRQLDELEQSGTEQIQVSDEVFGKIDCVVVKRLTRAVVEASWFPFREDRGGVYSPSESAVSEGIRMGNILTNKLQIRNETRETTYTRKSLGHIDKRLLAQLGTSNTSIFKKNVVDIYNPVLLYFTLDASESMELGDKWKNTLALAIAAATAATKINSLEVVITLRGCGRVNGNPIVVVAFDSRKDQLQKIRSVFPYLSPFGGTPEGLCYAATHKLIEECAKTHITHMVNVSDGEPGCHIFGNGNLHVIYSGDAAVKQTKREVRRLTSAGINVLSYFVTDGDKNYTDYRESSKKAFTEMYGPTATFVEPTQVTQIAKTLNTLLLTKEFTG